MRFEKRLQTKTFEIDKFFILNRIQLFLGDFYGITK